MIVIYPEQRIKTVFAVIQEIRDQYGHTELVGVYSSRIAADVIASDLPGRAWVKEFTIDAIPQRRRFGG